LELRNALKESLKSLKQIKGEVVSIKQEIDSFQYIDEEETKEFLLEKFNQLDDIRKKIKSKFHRRIHFRT